MEIESRIAQAIRIRMRESGGLYISSDLMKDRLVHFAIDNVDFLEDTPDGGNTLHGTVMVTYQKCDDGDVSSCLTMSRGDNELYIPESLYILKTIAIKAKHKPESPTLSIKLQGELVTSDLCSSIALDLVWRWPEV